MDKYSDIVKSFIELDYENKKSRLISLLDVFKAYSESIQKIMEYLQQDKITQEDMVDVYQSLVENIKNSNDNKLEVWLDKIVALHQKLQQIYDLESKERAQEDPDKLLELIE